jgi:hypothetical protein
MEHQEMVIPIHPRVVATVSCVKCQSTSVDIKDFIFEGIHVLVDCVCRTCSTRFYHTLPVAHDAQTPIAFSEDGSITRFDESARIWLAQPLIDAFFASGKNIGLKMKKKNLSPLKENVVLLNCIDDCFGHAYVKILNALELMKTFPDRSIVLLVTENFEWLVPKGVDELWIVLGRMSWMGNYLLDLQDFVKEQLKGIKRLDLSVAKVYHDLAKIDSEPFLKTKSFDVAKFDKLPRTVTFVLREDRYWHATKLDDFINRALISLRIQKLFRGYFIWKQKLLVEQTIRRLKNVTVNIIGPHLKNITPELEKQWCDIYSKSHVVIGVHGSNMLIPTSLAAGFIEILPNHKIAHIGEDTVLRHEGRYAVLLGRHVDQFSTPTLVADHIANMLDFSKISQLMNG